MAGRTLTLPSPCQGEGLIDGHLEETK